MKGAENINGYDVVIGKDGHSCTCGDFVYRRKDRGEKCKHILMLEEKLAERSRNEGDITKAE